MEKRFKIFRFDPGVDKEPSYQVYTVATEPRDRILDCLNRIKGMQDGSLGYRMSCGHGVCGSDGMRINGRCALACQKLVKDYVDADEILLEPLPFFKVLKDLIVDMEGFLQGVAYYRPYLITSGPPPAEERKQSPEEQKKIESVIRCILCACCTGSCPAMAENPDYVGPAALMWAFRYVYDSRDDIHVERLKKVDDSNGVWSCKNYFECTRVCPKGIPVTKNINTMKREIEKSLRKGGDSGGSVQS